MDYLKAISKIESDWTKGLLKDREAMAEIVILTKVWRREETLNNCCKRPLEG